MFAAQQNIFRSWNLRSGHKRMSAMTNPPARLHYALVKVGDAYIGLSDGHGEWQPRPASFHIYVPDCDAAYERAIEAGATGDGKPADQPYGDRSAGVTDPAGNRWFIATHLRDWKAAQ